MEQADKIDTCCVDNVRNLRYTRQSLQDRFDEECPYSLRSRNAQETTVKSWSGSLSNSFANVNPRRVLRNGAVKITQTVNNVRTTIGNLSQRFRRSTKRKHQLKCTDSPVTPVTKTRQVLGRTPTKLYSPFGIETPSNKENLRCVRLPGGKRSSPRNKRTTQCWFGTAKECFAPKSISPRRCDTYSPSNKFSNDVQNTQIGIYEFQSTANQIIRRSLRQ